MLHATHFLKFNYHSPIDFRNVYLGAKIWLNQANPYDDATLKAEWQKVCDEEQIINEHPPGLPQNFLVYPPSALLVYLPFSMLSWKWAAWINLIMCVAALGIIIYLVNRLFNNAQLSIAFTTLVVLAYKGTFHALLVGQPTFIFLAMAFSALWLSMRGKHIPAAILLGMALSKPTLALPVMIVLLIKREYNLLIFATIIQITLVIAAILLHNNRWELLQFFNQNIQMLMHQVYALGDVYYMRTLTDVGVWLNYLNAEYFVWWQWVMRGMLAMAVAYLYVKKIPINPVTYSVITLIVLLTSYHLFYDVLLLLPIVFVAINTDFKYKVVLAIISCPLFIPINGILDRTAWGHQFPIIYLHLPIVLAAILICLMMQWRISDARL